MGKKKQVVVKPKELVVTPPSIPQRLSIKSAGLLDGKFSLQLSNGDFLDGITEIVTGVPRYQDGVELKVTFFVNTRKPLTRENI